MKRKDNKYRRDRELKYIPNNISGIYRITNKINGKFYIGGSKDVRLRIRLHLNKLKNNKHENEHLQRSVNKYGIDNFKIEIISSCINDWTIIEKLENLYIEHLNPEYNIIRKSAGVFCSDITKKKLSNIQKEIWSKKSKELRNSYYKHLKKSIKTYNLITKEVLYYNSVSELERIINTSNISRKVNKYNCQTKGLLIFDKEFKIDCSKIQKIHSFTPIKQYSLDGKFIKQYLQISHAVKETNINKDSIKDVINGRKYNKTAGGYKWEKIKYYN